MMSPYGGANGARGKFRNRRPSPHTQIGQKGKGTGKPHGGGGPGGGPGGGGGQSTHGPGALGGWPTTPPKMEPFLPMTPGFERDQRHANDQLSAAEGAYAVGKIMTPAQIGLQKQRLNTDMGVATDQLNENLAERGIYTPWGANSTAANPQKAASPSGGGVGESLYRRHVATPFGRQYQDLGSQGAGQYADLAQNMGGSMLNYNQNMMEGLLTRASDAYQQQPMSIPFNYNLPHQANPQFSGQPAYGKTKSSGKGGKGGKNNKGRRGGK